MQYNNQTLQMSFPDELLAYIGSFLNHKDIFPLFLEHIYYHIDIDILDDGRILTLRNGRCIYTSELSCLVVDGTIEVCKILDDYVLCAHYYNNNKKTEYEVCSYDDLDILCLYYSNSYIYSPHSSNSNQVLYQNLIEEFKPEAEEFFGRLSLIISPNISRVAE